MAPSKTEMQKCVLLPPEVVSNFLVVLNWANYWGGSHLFWNSYKRKLQVTTSQWKLLKFAFMVYGWFVYVSFLALVVFNYAIQERRPLQEYQRALLLLMGALIPAAVLVATIAYETEFTVLTNALVDIAQLYEARYGLRTPKRANFSGFTGRLGKGIGMLVPMVKLYGVLAFLLSIYNPELQFFFTAFIPNEFKHPIITLGHAFVVMIFVFAVGGSIVNLAAILLLFAIVFFNLLDEINLQRKKYHLHRSLRTPENLAATSRSLLILSIIVEELYRYMALPLQVAITRSIHFTIFIVVRYHHRYSYIDVAACLAFSIMFGGGMLIVINVAGYAHRLNGKVLVSFRACSEMGFFKTKYERMYWRKVRRTLRPVTFRVGNFYIIKSKSGLKLCSDYVRGTVRLLVAVKRKSTALAI